MVNNAYKIFAAVSSSFLLLAAFGVAADTQNLQPLGPQITSVSETYFLGTNIEVKGTAMPGSDMLLSIQDQKNSFTYSITAVANGQGNWSAYFDQSLKSGSYSIKAVEKDNNGNELGQAMYGPVEIRGSFVIIVGVFSLLVIVLLAAFVGGWYISKFAEVKRRGRILISQRDVVASYTVLKNDTDKALENMGGDAVGAGKINETKFLLERISENLEKMNTYVAKGITTIGKYDIIHTIENKNK